MSGAAEAIMVKYAMTRRDGLEGAAGRESEGDVVQEPEVDGGPAGARHEGDVCEGDGRHEQGDAAGAGHEGDVCEGDGRHEKGDAAGAGHESGEYDDGHGGHGVHQCGAGRERGPGHIIHERIECYDPDILCTRCGFEFRCPKCFWMEEEGEEEEPAEIDEVVHDSGGQGELENELEMKVRACASCHTRYISRTFEIPCPVCGLREPWQEVEGQDVAEIEEALNWSKRRRRG